MLWSCTHAGSLSFRFPGIMRNWITWGTWAAILCLPCSFCYYGPALQCQFLSIYHDVMVPCEDEEGNVNVESNCYNWFACLGFLIAHVHVGTDMLHACPCHFTIWTFLYRNRSFFLPRSNTFSNIARPGFCVSPPAFTHQGSSFSFFPFH